MTNNDFNNAENDSQKSRNERFTIQGVGIADHERKRLYDLKTIDGFISIRDLLNEQEDEINYWKQVASQRGNEIEVMTHKLQMT